MSNSDNGLFGVDIANGLKILNNNTAIYVRLLNSFTQNKLYSELLEAVENNDGTGFAEKSHALKGVCANLRLEELFSVAKDLDGMAKAGITPTAGDPKVGELKLAYDKTLASVQKIIADPSILDSYK